MNSKQAHHDRAALPRIWELKAEGRSLREIADQLQQEGVPPPPRGRHWHHKAVDRILARADTRPEEATPPPASSITAVPAPPPVDPPPAPSPPEPAPLPPPAPRLNVKIQGPWIQSDSLLWEFLIHQVWEELPEKTEGILYHTIPLQAGLKGLRLTPRRRDREHLWEALDRLAASRVTLEGQLNNELLSISTPLLSAWVTEESLSFQFPAAVIKLVKNPQQYIRLKELFGAKH